MDGEPRTWEEVLAAVEQDAERAATLLATPSDAALPNLDTAPVILPALADMPPVPEDLRERIAELRERIDTLTSELADAIREWPSATHELTARRRLSGVAAAAAYSAPSRYVDRLV